MTPKLDEHGFAKKTFKEINFLGPGTGGGSDVKKVNCSAQNEQKTFKPGGYWFGLRLIKAVCND